MGGNEERWDPFDFLCETWLVDWLQVQYTKSQLQLQHHPSAMLIGTIWLGWMVWCIVRHTHGQQSGANANSDKQEEVVQVQVG